MTAQSSDDWHMAVAPSVRDERARWAPILAWGIAVLTLVIVTSAATLAFLNRATIHSLDEASLVEIILPIGFAILGGLVASRFPGNALGWLFLAISFANGLPGLTEQYTRFALVTHPGSPFTPWIPWIGDLTDSAVYPAGLAAVTLLTIPTGRFLTPRWRWVAIAGAIITLALEALTLSDPSALTLADAPPFPNPTGIPAMRGLDYGPVGVAAFFAGLLVLALAGACLILRWTRARGDERLQMRWIGLAAVISIVANIVATVFGIIFLPQTSADLLAIVATIFGFGIALPASFAVAILRYRLYDLDLLVNRAVVYGAVTAVLAVIFGIADITAQRAAQSVFNQSSDLISGALGVGAAVAFGPMRRRVRPVVDRFLPARGRLTLLFTDIVGSTEAIVDLGDERWRDVLNRYRVAVRQELSRYRGREVNTAGDAFFATFDRPAAAVECAQAIRVAVRRLGLGVRTGLHVGDVEMRGEQVSGLAVHAAARVMAEAGEDQILVSSELAELLGEGDTSLRDAGTHELKGVPGHWRLYAVGP
jgi:class 3 adenylate cyclase